MCSCTAGIVPSGLLPTGMHIFQVAGMSKVDLLCLRIDYRMVSGPVPKKLKNGPKKSISNQAGSEKTAVVFLHIEMNASNDLNEHSSAQTKFQLHIWRFPKIGVPP